MNCARELDALSYFYDELSETDKIGMENHLRECPACRDYLNDLAVVAKTSALDEPLPDELRGYTEKASRQVLRERHATSGRRLWMSAAASVAVVILCGLFALNIDNSPWNEPRSHATPFAAPVCQNPDGDAGARFTDDGLAEMLEEDALGGLDNDINYLISEKD